MTNANFPRGLQLYNDKGVQPVSIDAVTTSDTGSIIGAGDAIILEATGNVDRSIVGSTINQLGVATQFRDSKGGILLTMPAATDGTVGYVPFFGNRFLIQANGVLDADDVGALINLATPVDADPNTGVSKMELDIATVDAADGAFRILDKDPDSTWGEANVRVIVEANTSLGNTGTDTI
jgi:hypothetical protein